MNLLQASCEYKIQVDLLVVVAGDQRCPCSQRSQVIKARNSPLGGLHRRDNERSETANWPETGWLTEGLHNKVLDWLSIFTRKYSRATAEPGQVGISACPEDNPVPGLEWALAPGRGGIQPSLQSPPRAPAAQLSKLYRDKMLENSQHKLFLQMQKRSRRTDLQWICKVAGRCFDCN